MLFISPPPIAVWQSVVDRRSAATKAVSSCHQTTLLRQWSRCVIELRRPLPDTADSDTDSHPDLDSDPNVQQQSVLFC